MRARSLYACDNENSTVTHTHVRRKKQCLPKRQCIKNSMPCNKIFVLANIAIYFNLFLSISKIIITK